MRPIALALLLTSMMGLASPAAHATETLLDPDGARFSVDFPCTPEVEDTGKGKVAAGSEMSYLCTNASNMYNVRTRRAEAPLPAKEAEDYARKAVAALTDGTRGMTLSDTRIEPRFDAGETSIRVTALVNGDVHLFFRVILKGRFAYIVSGLSKPAGDKAAKASAEAFVDSFHL